ncbi:MULTISPECIES: helix-turn-helix domain-containing protein [Amycolatopsis]|uniref:Helix-turn-helix transcriptional regulator n=1 Tax=Amycolatopsis echigonensis TaxID=2576905 RepID=A0A2N3WNJ4_9PSEU|nr:MULTISPECIES: helix-turn-helix transcriptional regulator [Amycolatopsis]MBB2498391.1 helix-turn-helix transcriptional regulator [Amycolatopsis echigonensis]PKV95435.1 regulatory LuxR family protein [Amycolatopsis niigatensis]
MRLREDTKNFGPALLKTVPGTESPGGFVAAYLVAGEAAAVAANALHSAGLSVEPHHAGPSQIPRYSITGSRRQEKAGAQGLSVRERQIVALIAVGGDNQSIARELGLSVDTIKAHVRKVLAKMGARNRSHAVHIAHEWDILR